MLIVIFVWLTDVEKVNGALTWWTRKSGVSPVRALHNSRPKYRGSAWKVCQRFRIASHRHGRGTGAEIQPWRRRRTQAAETGQSRQDSSGGRCRRRRCCSGDHRGSTEDVVYSVRCGDRALLMWYESRKSSGCFDPRGRDRDTTWIRRGSCRWSGGCWSSGR